MTSVGSAASESRRSSGFPANESFLSRPIALDSSSFAAVRSTFMNPITREDPGLLQECAAVVIQCACRKHLAVKEYKKRKRVRDSSRRGSGVSGVAESFTIAVPSIEYADGEESLLNQAAATVIQTKTRQYQARKRVDKLKDEKKKSFENELQQSLETAAAITVQSAQRRYVATKVAKAKRRTSVDADTKGDTPDKKRSPEPAPSTTEGATGNGESPRQSTSPQHSDEPTRAHFSKRRQNRVGDTSVTGSISATSTGSDSHHHSPEADRHAAGDGGAGGEGRSSVSSSSGYGLSTLFYNATAVLLDRKAFVKSLWGVRILHAVAMDCKSRTFLPQLEVSRWVQGPLSSVIPVSELQLAPNEPHTVAHNGPSALASSPSSNRPTSATRLAPLEKSPSRPGSANKTHNQPDPLPPPRPTSANRTHLPPVEGRSSK
jgi:hypothetical protein